MEEIESKEVEKVAVSYGYLLPKEHPLHIPPHVALARLVISCNLSFNCFNLGCPNLLKEKDVENMRLEIDILHARNTEKDKGKKFEGSWTRVLVIMLLTYATLTMYMSVVLHVKNPFLNALVPTMGFNLSTWSLPHVKALWIRWHDFLSSRSQDDIRTSLRRVNDQSP